MVGARLILGGDWGADFASVLGTVQLTVRLSTPPFFTHFSSFQRT